MTSERLHRRLHRQMLIEGWDQEALTKKILVVGDDPVYTSLFILSSAALGIINHRVVANSLDNKIIEIARSIEPSLTIEHYEGGYHNSILDELLLKEVSAIIDLTSYNLPKKLLVNAASRKGLELVLSNIENDIMIYTYKKGREFKDVEKTFGKSELHPSNALDPIKAIISSGVILEETKKILMGQKTDDALTDYSPAVSDISNKEKKNLKVLVVGAGALGNFVALSLGYLGIENIEIMDPDLIEETNLNRQVLLYGSVGKPKAETLAKRINELFGSKARARIEYFRKGTDVSKYDVIFDCVDNFETRIILSESAKKNKKILISGGTSFKAGQAVAYVPGKTEQTPAEALQLYDIVDKRRLEKEYVRERTSCTYRPDPSVIMSNQIIGAIMVDYLRKIINGEKVFLTYYNADASDRIRDQKA